MDAAEIVIREVQGASGFQVGGFLGESVCQSGKPSHHHAYGQILPLYKTGGDMLLIRVALHDLGYALHDWAWGVLCFRVMLAIISVQLHKLSKVHVRTKGTFNRVHIKPESVRGDLDAVSETFREVANQGFRCRLAALAYGVTGNQFCIGINSAKNPLVSKLFGVILPDALLLLKTERPNFITLDKATFQIAHSFVKQFLATFSGQDEQLQNRVTMQTCKPFRGTHRATLNQALNRFQGYFLRDSHGSKQGSRLRFRKRCRTGCTAVTLDSLLSVNAKLLDCLVIAFPARHGFSPLALCGGKADNKFGSEWRLTPRFGLAPLPVEAGSGALSQRIKLGWWFNRNFHGLTGSSEANFNSDSHCCFILSQGPVTAGPSDLSPKSLRKITEASPVVSSSLPFNYGISKLLSLFLLHPRSLHSFCKRKNSVGYFVVFVLLFFNRLFGCKPFQQCVDGLKEILLCAGFAAVVDDEIANFSGRLRSVRINQALNDKVTESRVDAKKIQYFLVAVALCLAVQQIEQSANSKMSLPHLSFKLIAFTSQSNKLHHVFVNPFPMVNFFSFHVNPLLIGVS